MFNVSKTATWLEILKFGRFYTRPGCSGNIKSKMALQPVGKPISWCKFRDSQKSSSPVPGLEVCVECSQEDLWTLKSPQITGDNRKVFI